MRENARQKAGRYLVEGRLAVTAVSDRHGGSVQATARGEGASYSLGWSPLRGWHCSCPAKSEACAHLFALKRVVVIDIEGEP